MGKPIAGEVVVIPFPQTNLQSGKPRPALALVNLPGDDLILCQITSQARHDGFSIPLASTGIEQGSLSVASFVRPNRLFTVEHSVVRRSAGKIKRDKLLAVLSAVRDIFS